MEFMYLFELLAFVWIFGMMFILVWAIDFNKRVINKKTRGMTCTTR